MDTDQAAHVAVKEKAYRLATETSIAVIWTVMEGGREKMVD